MKIIFLIIVLLILLNCSFSLEENSIIRIPNKEGNFKNISTKNGFINYLFYHRNSEDICNMIFITYVLGGIKNLNLFELPQKTNNNEFNIYGNNNDNLEIVFYNEETDTHNPLLCQIFYKTKYIDKMIYSIGKNEYREPYKFFGGTPQNITKNLNKFTLNTKEITEIKIEFANGTNYIIDEFDNKLVEFKEGESSMLCLPEDILIQFQKLFLNQFKECTYNFKLFEGSGVYKLNEGQKKLFPNINFKIGNKILILNQENAFWPKYITEDIYLFINSRPCNNFVFGLKFLQLFDVSEFNLDSGEINLYLNKNKNYIVDEKENYKNENLKSNIHIIFIIFSIFIFSITLTYSKKYVKNKKIEYYNYYYEI